MKSYSILIHGTGACGEGTADCADMAFQELLQKLQASGHQVTSASMVIDGSVLPIIGAAQPHPAADEAADPGAVTLNRLAELLTGLEGKVTAVLAGRTNVVAGSTEDITLEDVHEGVMQVLELMTAPPVAAKKKGGGVKGAPVIEENMAGSPKVDQTAAAEPPKGPPPSVMEETTGDLPADAPATLAPKAEVVNAQAEVEAGSDGMS